MNARELVNATKTKIIFVAYKERVDKAFPNKEIPFEVKIKDGIGKGILYLCDDARFERHYNIGYCLSKLGVPNANYVAWWIDKTKIFKPEKFEFDFENKILLVHLKLIK